MPQRVAKKTLYLNADRTRVVGEDSPDAAFLLVRAGSAVNEDAVARVEKSGVKVSLDADEVADFDARAAHEAEHGTKAQAAPDATKAVSRAPANKGA